MELSQIARVALGGQLHTMLTSETTIDNHHHTMLTPKTTVHTFAQLHTTHPRSPKPKLGHWKTIVHCPAYYNYSPPLYLQEISISICFVRRGSKEGWGVGQIGPRFAAGLKIAPRSTPWHGQPTGSSLLLVLPMSVGTRRGFQRYSGFQFSV